MKYNLGPKDLVQSEANNDIINNSSSLLNVQEILVKECQFLYLHSKVILNRQNVFNWPLQFMVTVLHGFNKLYLPAFIVVQNLILHNFSLTKRDDKLFKTILQYFEKSLKQTVVLTDDFKKYMFNVKLNTDLYPLISLVNCDPSHKIETRISSKRA